MSVERKIPVLEVDGLTFGYNHVPAIEDISFSLNRGDYLWVIGPNGSGKTTLVKAILGILNPVVGRVSLFGAPLAGFTQWGRIAYVPQKIAFFDPYFPASVKEVCSMGLLAERGSSAKASGTAKSRVEESLKQVGVLDIKNRRIGELSGGQLQRVLLARALITAPEIIFLDEPTAAVEPTIRQDFFALIDTLNRAGTTIVLINHDIGGMNIHNNKILYINKRRIFFGEGGQFCIADDMSDYFGQYQHIICHQHAEDGTDHE